MDPIEKAIRGALEKGNPEDTAFRRRIYASAEQALVRSLSANTALSPSEQTARVQHLRIVAAAIESDFSPAVAPELKPQGRPAAPQQPPRPVPGRVEPRMETPQRDPVQIIGERRVNGERRAAAGPRAEEAGALQSDAEKKAARQDERRRRSKVFNRLAGLFVFVTLLAMAVMLGWSIWTSDMLNSRHAADERSAASGPTRQDADSANWITVFMPSDISSVQLGDGVSADLQGKGNDAMLHMLSKGGAGQAVFEVGRGILESLQGRKVVFDVRGHTEDGSNVEIAVGCELAGMGQCQRTRFHLDGQVTDNLLIVQLADSGPEASGTLTLTPDLGATGKPVNIQSIRVRVEP